MVRVVLSTVMLAALVFTGGCATKAKVRTDYAKVMENITKDEQTSDEVKKEAISSLERMHQEEIEREDEQGSRIVDLILKGATAVGVVWGVTK